jgi:hypothetical protein
MRRPSFVLYFGLEWRSRPARSITGQIQRASHLLPSSTW